MGWARRGGGLWRTKTTEELTRGQSLGAGGSGKSTLRKQFEVLYGTSALVAPPHLARKREREKETDATPPHTAGGYSDAAKRKPLRDVIISNLVEGVKAIVTASFDESISGGGLTADASLQASAVINAASPDSVALTDELVQAIHTLYRDPVFQKTMMRASMYQLQECVPYFLTESLSYPEWGGPKWIPSVDDCVRSRTRTSGIVEIEFELDRVRYRVLDAGGQRAERRKWLHAFEDVTALIFVAALTEYDEVLFEDKSKNRLQESLEVFDETVNNKFFSSTPVVLFLNKMDLFVEKYVRRGTPLNVSGLFPDAPAYTPEFPKAIEWIANEFRKRRRGATSDPSMLMIHTTTAVDGSHIDHVFKDVQTIILSRQMQEMQV